MILLVVFTRLPKLADSDMYLCHSELFLIHILRSFVQTFQGTKEGFLYECWSCGIVTLFKNLKLVRLIFRSQ